MSFDQLLATSLLRLKPDERSRDKACASRDIAPGEVVLTVPAWATSLIEDYKGKRCDFCNRAQTKDLGLRRCTGCTEAYYCGQLCQSAHWTQQHKTVCKKLPHFLASEDYRRLNVHKRADAALLFYLTHSISKAEREAFGITVDFLDQPSPLKIFLSLLPWDDGTDIHRSSSEGSLAEALESRFRNNNFMLHSHLDPPFAHGAFPLASRTLNHSCTPNALPKFILREGYSPTMEVIAISAIRSEEEVTIPYHDPAIPVKERRQALFTNYNFNCSCALCVWSLDSRLDEESSTSELPRDPSMLQSFNAAVQEFSLPPRLSGEAWLLSQQDLFKSLPKNLVPAFNPSYLPALSEAFSRASHEGDKPQDGLEVGRTLLALYRIIYPPGFPLNGLHALELCKVVWNAVCIGPSEASKLTTAQVRLWEEKMLESARGYLSVAEGVLHCYGIEGDVGGPIAEIETMRKLLVK